MPSCPIAGLKYWVTNGLRINVGRHIPETERKQPFPATLSLSDRIFQNMDESRYRDRLGLDSSVPEQVEEVESDEDDDAADHRGQVGAFEEKDVEEREALKEELVRIMKERFLDGDDDEFDYDDIDSAEYLDDFRTSQQDHEDAYFSD
jgi:hypothetical protein